MKGAVAVVVVEGSCSFVAHGAVSGSAGTGADAGGGKDSNGDSDGC